MTQRLRLPDACAPAAPARLTSQAVLAAPHQEQVAVRRQRERRAAAKAQRRRGEEGLEARKVVRRALPTNVGVLRRGCACGSRHQQLAAQSWHGEKDA